MAIQIGEKTLSVNGSSHHSLSQNGADVEWKAVVKTTLPWQPSSYDENKNTLDYCFKPTAELLAYVSMLEAEVFKEVSAHSATYFGEATAPEVVKQRFQSGIKTSHLGLQHFKCKGRSSSIKFWDKNQKATNQPTVWNKDDEFKFIVCAGALWFNDKAWGISYDLRHLQTFASDCPF